MLPFLAIELHASWSTGLMFAAPSAGAFTGPRFSLTSGGLACVAAVAAVYVALPALRHYTAPPSASASIGDESRII
jgi:hypothetical protein